MKIRRLIQTPEVSGVFRTRLLIVCFFFAFGAIAGALICDGGAGQDAEQLRLYLMEYARYCTGPRETTVSLFSVLLLYFRYPLALFVCGFLGAGIVAAPVLCLLQGCFLSFSISCFTAALGRSGLLLALSLLGLRVLFVVPCTLFLAVGAMERAGCLVKARLNGKRERVAQPSLFYWQFAYCALLLSTGVILELSMVPKLFAFALKNI